MNYASYSFIYSLNTCHIFHWFAWLSQRFVICVLACFGLWECTVYSGDVCVWVITYRLHTVEIWIYAEAHRLQQVDHKYRDDCFLFWQQIQLNKLSDREVDDSNMKSALGPSATKQAADSMRVNPLYAKVVKPADRNRADVETQNYDGPSDIPVRRTLC